MQGRCWECAMFSVLRVPNCDSFDNLSAIEIQGHVWHK